METKQTEKRLANIETSFRKQVQQGRSGFLLVHSEDKGIHLNLTEGLTSQNQPVYMASVGKLFTSVIIGMLVERGQLAYDDSITNHLHSPMIDGLHVFEGREYTDHIQIKHLLNHTSGLPDNFRPLLQKLQKDPSFTITPEEAITWTKKHVTPHFSPGNGYTYTDTNYHLLGLIIENVLKKSFYEVLHDFIFTPLGMSDSSMLGYSTPNNPTEPMADFYIDGIPLKNVKGYAGLDYAGGGVVSTGEDLLMFMKALTSYQLVEKGTLVTMMSDKVKYELGIDYGYGLMMFKKVPVLMPKAFQCWGHAGATGAFMFYYPKLDTYIIGNFNDFSYERKAVRFMLLKVINQLV